MEESLQEWLWQIVSALGFLGPADRRQDIQLSIAKYRDGSRFLCRSGLVPDMPGKEVGDEPRPTVASGHTYAFDSVVCNGHTFRNAYRRR